MLAGLVAGLAGTDTLVRSTSACFLAVYVLALGSAVRILDGRARLAACAALGLALVVAVFSSLFLLVPAFVALAALAIRGASNRTPNPTAMASRRGP